MELLQDSRHFFNQWKLQKLNLWLRDNSITKFENLLFDPNLSENERVKGAFFIINLLEEFFHHQQLHYTQYGNQLLPYFLFSKLVAKKSSIKNSDDSHDSHDSLKTLCKMVSEYLNKYNFCAIFNMNNKRVTSYFLRVIYFLTKIELEGQTSKTNSKTCKHIDEIMVLCFSQLNKHEMLGMISILIIYFKRMKNVYNLSVVEIFNGSNNFNEIGYYAPKIMKKVCQKVVNLNVQNNGSLILLPENDCVLVENLKGNFEGTLAVDLVGATGPGAGQFDGGGNQVILWDMLSKHADSEIFGSLDFLKFIFLTSFNSLSSADPKNFKLIKKLEDPNNFENSQPDKYIWNYFSLISTEALISNILLQNQNQWQEQEYFEVLVIPLIGILNKKLSVAIEFHRKLQSLVWKFLKFKAKEEKIERSFSESPKRAKLDGKLQNFENLFNNLEMEILRTYKITSLEIDSTKKIDPSKHFYTSSSEYIEDKARIINKFIKNSEKCLFGILKLYENLNEENLTKIILSDNKNLVFIRNNWPYFQRIFNSEKHQKVIIGHFYVYPKIKIFQFINNPDQIDFEKIKCKDKDKNDEKSDEILFYQEILTNAKNKLLKPRVCLCRMNNKKDANTNTSKNATLKILARLVENLDNRQKIFFEVVANPIFTNFMSLVIANYVACIKDCQEDVFPVIQVFADTLNGLVADKEMSKISKIRDYCENGTKDCEKQSWPYEFDQKTAEIQKAINHFIPFLLKLLFDKRLAINVLKKDKLRSILILFSLKERNYSQEIADLIDKNVISEFVQKKCMNAGAKNIGDLVTELYLA